VALNDLTWYVAVQYTAALAAREQLALEAGEKSTRTAKAGGGSAETVADAG